MFYWPPLLEHWRTEHCHHNYSLIEKLHSSGTTLGHYHHHSLFNYNKSRKTNKALGFGMYFLLQSQLKLVLYLEPVDIMFYNIKYVIIDILC